ncbi:MAG: hypothetical protein AAFO97_00810 [Pseudomonadota bacterium]
MISKFSLALPVFMAFTVGATAQEAQFLKGTVINDWEVSKLETPRDGLSCQALKCTKRPCNADTSQATLRLWGSKRRQAVTPMMGMQRTTSGARRAKLTIANSSFPLEQSQKSRGKLFIAKDAADDIEIIRLMIANPKGTVDFSSSKGGVKFPLTGIEDVLAFFQRECSIPRP